MNRAPFKESGALAIAPQAWGHEFEFGPRTKELFATEGAAAVVDVRGPLVNGGRYFWWDSYPQIRARAAAAFDSSQGVVVLRIDSPGGDVKGCFELARELRAMAVAKEKPLVAYVDGMAASAAYALASAASRIVLPATAFVGSIGIIEALCDQTQLDEQLGLRFAIITSGERKADGNPHVPLTKGTTTAMQGHVDALAELFFELVAELRGVAPEKTRAMEAALFLGANAITAGLADAVDTWPNLLASLEARGDASTDNTNKNKNKGTAMPNYLDDAKKALQKATEEGTDEEKAAAKKMLKAADGDPPPSEKKEEKKDDAKKAEGEEKKEPEPEKKEAKKAEDEKKDAEARAAGVDVVAMAKALHEIQTERAAEKDKTERDALLAKRPDFSAEVQATLRVAPLDVLRTAVETWPRGPGAGGKAYNPAAAANATGTRGTSQGNGEANALPIGEADFIDRAMGFGANAGEIKRERNQLELGVMSPEQARAKLAELDKKGAA